MFKIRRTTAATLAVAFPALARRHSQAPRRLVTISGATASYPLVSLLAQRYVKLHTPPHKIHFRITQGGPRSASTTWPPDGHDGDVSRDPIASDQGKDLYFYPIARYEICVDDEPEQPGLEPQRGQNPGHLHGCR